MFTIDLNCDMGEGIGNDELIMSFISSANIACGYHAGDEQSILQTIELAITNKVSIGAHISFFDRINFGRVEMELPLPEVYELVTQQLVLFYEIADSFNTKPFHVKPHGALYNMSARQADLAKTIAHAVKDFDHELVLFGLSGSCSIREAKDIGLRTVNEVFADRTYQEDGSLTARSQPNALVKDPAEAIQQVLQMIKEGTVTAVSGKKIPILAETICLHGDGKQAEVFAKTIHGILSREGILIKAIQG